MDSVAGVLVAVGAASFFIVQRRPFAAAISGRRQNRNSRVGRIGERGGRDKSDADAGLVQDVPRVYEYLVVAFSVALAGVAIASFVWSVWD